MFEGKTPHLCNSTCFCSEALAERKAKTKTMFLVAIMKRSEILAAKNTSCQVRSYQ